MPLETKPVLCYVTDRRALGPQPPAGTGAAAAAAAALVEAAARAASLGVDWIQVREKDLHGGPLLKLVSDVQKRAGPARILVNDRLDVALAAGAGGVHLGGEGLPVAAVRASLGKRDAGSFLVGKSCHSLGEARAAQTAGADYIFFGPVFATPSKLAYGAPQGIDRLAGVCRALTIPVVAIGGISPDNAAECLAAGAQGVAAIRCFQQSDGLAARIARLRAVCG
ncbi:MAG TPA: thiamine phosphate synthase [Patescibacteria group bacterium]|nr:thiamine phosphate synthase [Patescibacteria group bacterium]